MRDKAIGFLRANVVHHEEYFCFHLRLLVRHFDTYLNVAHEGPNKGIKYGAAPVWPQHNMDKTAEILCFVGRHQSDRRRVDEAKNLGKHNLWSELPTAQHLIGKGEGLLNMEWREKSNNSLIRIAPGMCKYSQDCLTIGVS